MIEAHLDEHQMTSQPLIHPAVDVCTAGVLAPIKDKMVRDELLFWGPLTTPQTVQAVFGQILELNAKIRLLGEQRAAPAMAPVSLDGLQIEVQLRVAQLRRQSLHTAMRILGEFQSRRKEEQTRRELEASAATGLSSPAMEVWQRLIEGQSAEVIDLPSELALVEELLASGMFNHNEAGMVAQLSRQIANILARNWARGHFFDEIATPFVKNYLDLLTQAALSIRTLVAHWILDRPAETGSAAAIAKRLNPLGAPPQLA